AAQTTANRLWGHVLRYGGLSIHLSHIGRTSTAGPLTMVTAKNSTTSTPSASAIAIERCRRLFFCASVRTIPTGSGLSAIPFSCAPCHRSQRPVHDLGKQGRKQRKQIKYGESKKLAGRAQRLAALTADINVDREHQHAGAEHQRGDAVD